MLRVFEVGIKLTSRQISKLSNGRFDARKGSRGANEDYLNTKLTRYEGAFGREECALEERRG